MKRRKWHLAVAIIVVSLLMIYNFFLADRLNADDFNCATATNINVLPSECSALTDLYVSTQGGGRTTSTNWNTNTDVCTRYGISCIDIE